MAKLNSNTRSLISLFKAAPMGSIQSLLASIDDGIYCHSFRGVLWPNNDDMDLNNGASIYSCRMALCKIANELDNSIQQILEQHAYRILTLAEEEHTRILSLVCQQLQTDGDKFAALQEQLDHYGRAIWLYLNEPMLYHHAENIFHANHYRDLGRVHESFEVDHRASEAFVWNEGVKLRFEQALCVELGLTEACFIDHMELCCTEEGTLHLLIVRHAGPLSSVADLSLGHARRVYYRPSIEASLAFNPALGIIEVFAELGSLRPRIALAFTQAALKQNLSERPLSLRQFNLSRFLKSMQLDLPPLPDYEIENVAVIDAEVRSQDLGRRIRMKLEPEDDFDEAARELLGGTHHIFQRSAAICRIVIAVRFWNDQAGMPETFNITLSDPNRCNLRSQRDPIKRRLGYALLKHWGILENVRQLSASELGSLFPALLELYELSDDEITRRHLLNRGLPIEDLIAGGFLIRRGRYERLHVEMNRSDRSRLVPLMRSRRPGTMVYTHPDDGRTVEVPAEDLQYYRIKRDWLEELVVKSLCSALKVVGSTLVEAGLIYLGQLSLGHESIPVYLARGLLNVKRLRECDLQLRARTDTGIGVVLTASLDAPAFLGANVVVSLHQVLQAEANELTLDLEKLGYLYQQGKNPARGGSPVNFVEDGNRSATLFIPGKAPLMLTGPKQIMLVGKLFKAYQKGQPAVRTQDLLGDTGVKTPSQAFRNWDMINGVYIGKADKRGAWRLLV